MKEFQFKRATAARWASQNPILKKGEPGVEMETGSTTAKMKYGDGVHTWNELPYFGGESNSLEIPELILFKENGKLYAKWSSFNTSFLAHNPKIRLFRHSKNSKQSDIARPYFDRPSSVKMRMMTRFQVGVTKTIEWACPTAANTPVEITVNVNEWVKDRYDGGVYWGVYMQRKSRHRLLLAIAGGEALAHWQAQIAVTYGLAIVIDNPLPDVRPYRIWDRVTAFKMGAIKSLLPTPSITKNIRLR